MIQILKARMTKNSNKSLKLLKVWEMMKWPRKPIVLWANPSGAQKRHSAQRGSTFLINMTAPVVRLTSAVNFFKWTRSTRFCSVMLKTIKMERLRLVQFRKSIVAWLQPSALKSTLRLSIHALPLVSSAATWPYALRTSNSYETKILIEYESHSSINIYIFLNQYKSL